jgi:succinate dehydrogenase / fumarate reductase iron-sulfur subunit
VSELTIRIKRQASAAAAPTWAAFSLPEDTNMTVADALDALDADVTWGSDCEWPACGVCTMLVNGRARAACTTRIADVVDAGKPLVLEPLHGFVVLRDLWVDKRRLVRGTAQLRPWSADARAEALAAAEPFARCTDCGACIDACPEAGADFVGAAAIGAYHHAALHGAVSRDGLIARGGIGSCGLALACVAACPEQIPLDDAIARAHHDGARHLLATNWLAKLLGR